MICSADMTLPTEDTPLYNHPLPEIEGWLVSRGCEQDRNHLHCWFIDKTDWQAEIVLEVDSLVVRYLGAGSEGQDLQRIFKYSLSRKDLDEAIFSGP